MTSGQSGTSCKVQPVVGLPARPDPPVEVRPTGKAARPLPGAVYHPSRGRASPPSALPYLERKAERSTFSIQPAKSGMHYLRLLTIAAVALLASACSTTQSVSMAKLSPTKQITTVAQVAADGNSPEMDRHLESALKKEGLVLRAKLPVGTATAKDVDALVSYADIWRWDIVMYLKNITVRVNDATSGDLIASAEWTESHFHQFRGEAGVKEVVERLVSDLMTKIRSSTKPAQ